MYNTPMPHLFYIVTILVLFFSGCAELQTYEPVRTAIEEKFSLNETQLNNVNVGMTQDAVHALLGQELIVGYSYQNNSSDAKPITIANPYKTAEVTTNMGECTVEYYVTAIHQPDGIISDDELMPLTFCRGVLTAKGRK